MFTLNVVWYLFLAGAGSGLVFIVFIIDSSLRQFKPLSFLQLKPLIAPGLVTGLVLTSLGGLLLTIDVGRVDRLLMLVAHPALSIISLGFWTILIFQLSVTAQLLIRVFFHPRLPNMVHIVIRWLSGLSGLVIMIYTGLFFQSLQAVAFWNTWLLPVLIVLSSLSAGIVLLMFLNLFGCNCMQIAPQHHNRARLVFAHIVILVCELVVLAAYLIVMISSPGEAAAAADQLLSGSLAPWFWLGVVGAGIAVPLVLEGFRNSRHTKLIVVAGSLLVLIGAFALRYCLTQVGAHAEITPFFML